MLLFKNSLYCLTSFPAMQFSLARYFTTYFPWKLRTFNGFNGFFHPGPTGLLSLHWAFYGSTFDVFTAGAKCPDRCIFKV